MVSRTRAGPEEKWGELNEVVNKKKEHDRFKQKTVRKICSSPEWRRIQSQIMGLLKTGMGID